MKKLIIHSDGFETVILDEDGNRIEGVIEATIRLEASNVATVDLTIIAPQVNVSQAVPDVTYLLCPVCAEQHSHDCKPNTLGGT